MLRVETEYTRRLRWQYVRAQVAAARAILHGVSEREIRRELRRLRLRIWYAERSTMFAAAYGVVIGVPVALGLIHLLNTVAGGN